jgi:hypothetical protein
MQQPASVSPCFGTSVRDGALHSLSVGNGARPRRPEQQADVPNDKNMRPEEYLLASLAIHNEMRRLTDRLQELARFRCAEPSNQVFLNVMSRHAELLGQLDKMHERAAEGLRKPTPTRTSV